MPETAGAWVPNASTAKRMRLRAVWSVGKASAGSTTVPVSLKIYVDAWNTFWDNATNFSVRGDMGTFSGSKSVNVPNKGSQEIYSYTMNSPLWSTNYVRKVWADLSGVGYVGNSAKASLYLEIPIPARSLKAPNPPTDLHIASSTERENYVVLSWQHHSDADNAPQNFAFRRYKHSTGTWFGEFQTSASSRSTERSYAAEVDDKITVQMWAVNSAGKSAAADFPSFYTPPAAASGLSVSRAGDHVDLEWTVNARFASVQVIEQQTSSDGGYSWSEWRAIRQVDPTTTSATLDISPDGELSRWRIDTRVFNPDQMSNFNTPSEPTESLQTLSPPAAPSILGPRTTQQAGMPITLKWRHNSLDASPQTEAEVQWRDSDGRWWGGGDWQSVRVGAASTAQINPPADIGAVEWRVRTRGSHWDFGPWSSVATIQISAPPSVTITHPKSGQDLSSNRAQVTIDFHDDGGAALVSWTATLRSLETGTLETLQLDGDKLTARFNTVLTDKTRYAIDVQVTAGTGLRGQSTTEFTTRFLLPAKPSVEAEWVADEGVVRLVVHAADGDDRTIAVTHALSVERSLDGGETWTLVAPGLSPGAGLDDFIVPLNHRVLYRAVAVAATGTETPGDPVAVLTTSGVTWLQDADGQGFRLVLGQEVAWQPSAEVQLETYLGRERPTMHIGRARPLAISLSGVLISGFGLEQEPSWLLAREVLCRTPAGHVAWCAVTNLDLGQSNDKVRRVRLQLEAVHHEE